MKNAVSNIYRRELKNAFCSLFGWAFIAVNIAAIGIFTAWINLKGAFNAIEYSFELAAIVLCVSAPLLSASMMSAELNRGETDLLLRYVPASALMTGRYLAWLTLHLIPTAAALVTPLICGSFGNIVYSAAYAGALGYFLTGAAILALCLYISSSISRPWLSFAVSAVVILLLNTASNISHSQLASPKLTFTFIAIALFAGAAILVYFYLRNGALAAIVAVAGSVLTVILNLTGAISAAVRWILMFISPYHAYSELIYGTMSLLGMIQPVLFTALFFLFSIMRHTNRRGKELV